MLSRNIKLKHIYNSYRYLADNIIIPEYFAYIILFFTITCVFTSTDYILSCFVMFLILLIGYILILIKLFIYFKIKIFEQLSSHGEHK